MENAAWVSSEISVWDGAHHPLSGERLFDDDDECSEMSQLLAIAEERVSSWVNLGLGYSKEQR